MASSPLTTTLRNVTTGSLTAGVLTVGNTSPVWSNNTYTIGPALSVAANATTASINANGTIKCKDLEIDDFSMKDILKQISTQVGLFIPPNTETLNVPAVQMAYTEYRNAREAFMKAKENLDLMVDLCRQSSKED